MKAKGEIANVAALGAAGSGKTPWVQAQVRKAKPARLLVWDPMQQWGAFGQVFADRLKFIDHVAGAARFTAIYQPGEDMDTYRVRFDWFCRLAYKLQRLTIVAEELAHVTAAASAPAGWKACTTLGGHRHLRVYGTSQFPASIDKAFLSNATVIHCGRIFEENAAKTMVGLLGVDRAELARLPDGAWFERNMKTGAPAVRGAWKG